MCFSQIAAGFGGCFGVAIGFSLTAGVEIVYWLLIKVKEEQCKGCTRHHYPTHTSKRMTTCIQKSCIAAFLIFTGWRFYLVFDRVFFNPPRPEEVKNQIYDYTQNHS